MAGGASGNRGGASIPRRDLKRRAKDLGAHEFGHGCGAQAVGDAQAAMLDCRVSGAS